jgi:hypothetical protein
MKRKALVISGLFFIVILVFPTILFWKDVKGTFFNFSYMDMLYVACTFLIGIVGAVYITQSFKKSAKRLEIIFENFDNLIGYYENIIRVISDFSNKKLTQSAMKYLTRLFRFASNEINDTREYFAAEKPDDKILHDSISKTTEEHLDIKAFLTDIPFQRNHTITEDEIKRSMDYYHTIKQQIQKIKLHLYT